MEQLLESIRNISNKRFPLEEIEAIIGRKDEAIPYLLQIMRDLKEDHEPILGDPFRIDYMYAHYLLAQFQVKEYFPILIDLLSLPSEVSDRIFNDSLTEGMGRVLASVYNGDIDLLKQLIENSEANVFGRAQALESMVILVYNDQLSREMVMEYSRQLMTTKLKPRDYYFNAEVVCCCDNLYPEEVYSEINRMYEDEVVDISVIGLRHVAKTLKVSKEAVLQANRQDPKFQLIQDTISEMQNWYCFQPEPLKGGNANLHSLFNKQQVTVGVKIGRNDPCSCGSGLKHKKCCGK